jgi:hypothetical protein
MTFKYIINADTHFIINYTIPVKVISSVTMASNQTGSSVMLLTSAHQELSSNLGQHTVILAVIFCGFIIRQILG